MKLGSRPLRLLLVEDNPDDCELLVRELGRHGYAVDFHRVETPEAMRGALADPRYQLVISDFTMPRFNARAALQVLHDSGVDLPFIVVSGTVGEDIAVQMMQEGAHDYIMKENLTRLAPTVDRQLRETEIRRERAGAQQALRQAEEQLRQAQKMEALGRLAGGVAHDFNNLLTLILAYGEILQDTLAANTEVCAQLEEICQAAQRGASLTRQLLAYSRQQVLQPRVLRLDAVLKGLETMLRRLLGEDLVFVSASAADLWCVRADPGQIEQVVMNLVVNARDAMPNGGRLTVELENVAGHPGPVGGRANARDYVRLSVRDTGSGIPPEVLPRIFEPFMTTKERGKGTGLGLSTVDGIVNQSGGFIVVDTAVGRGTTFEVYLPRAEGRSSEVAAVAATPERRRGAETVLLVEDDEGVRAVVDEILRAQGYRVLATGSPAEAEEVLRQFEQTVHLLVTDVILPGMSGIQLAHRVAKDRPTVRLLLMSGYTDEMIPAQAIDPSMVFLQKPFRRPELLDKVAEALASAPWRPPGEQL